MSASNSDYQDIVSYIEHLHSSRHLIAQAYCDGSIDILEENSRLLRQLQQIRVMRNNVNREESLRLSSVMMKMLDQAVHRVRTMKGSTNLNDHISRMYTLAEGYLKAGIEGRLEDQEVYSSDFDLAAYDVAEEVDVMLMHVDTMAHNNFANVSSYSEKIRQNEHYLKEMKRLVDAMGILNDPALIDILESSLDLQPLSLVYSSHILNNMHKWRAKLLDIIAHLERYMHKVREIEPKARRIRVFSMFFHRHPEYNPRETEEYPHIPEWAYRHEGLDINPVPDVLNEEQAEPLIPIAYSIERADSITTKVRQGGMLIDDDEDLEQVVYIQPTPFEEAVHQLVHHARTTGTEVSAKAFFASNPLVNEIAGRVTLICLASLLDNSPKSSLFGFDDLTVKREVEQELDPASGNVFIEDFKLCLRH